MTPGVATSWLRERAGPVACALLVLVAAVWENPALVAREEPDTVQYAAVAQSLHHDLARDRPPMYPLYLRLCMFTSDWKRTAVAGQKLSLAVLAAVLVSLFRRFGLPAGWSATGAFLCSISPATMRASDTLLPELCVVVGLILLWRLVLGLDGKRGARQVRAAALTGLLSGSVALLKPVWVGGIVFVGAAWLLSKKGEERPVRAVAAMTECHVLVCASWIAFLAVQFGQFTLSHTGTIAYFGLMVPLLSFQDQNFMRYRAEIDAVMLAVAGGPLAGAALSFWRQRAAERPT